MAHPEEFNFPPELAALIHRERELVMCRRCADDVWADYASSDSTPKA